MRATPNGTDPDAMIDVRCVLQEGHREVEVGELPPVLRPRKGRFGLVDHEKVFSPDPEAGDVFVLSEIDRDNGCVVVVRPDQSVSHVLPLSATTDLAEFFESVLVLRPTDGSGL